MSSPLRALAVAFLFSFVTHYADAASFAGTFVLQNRSASQCLSIAGMAVILTSCKKASSGPQVFTTEPDGNGNIVLKNVETHQCLSNSKTGIVLAIGVWKKANRPDRNMMFSISLTTKADPSLAHVAAGQYDDAFTETAKHIAIAYPNAVIRIGWEFNGGWYPWAGNGRQQDYVNAFRRVSRIFTSVSPTFTIDWCTAFGKFQFPPDQAYPGDDVVDVIGTDAYDNVQYDGAGGDPVKRWKLMVEQPYGLAWQKRFASAHRKPMSWPEWGINADDPYFIEQMYNWITANNFAYASYWDSNSSFKSKLSHDQYPKAAAKFKELFSRIP